MEPLLLDTSIQRIPLFAGHKPDSSYPITIYQCSASLASPQTSFEVCSSRIHFSPKWMRDKQTKRPSAGRLQQAKVTWHAKGRSSWSWVARHYRCNSLKTNQQNINNFLQHLWHYFTMMNWIEEPKRMQSYMCWLSQERCQREAEDSWIKLVWMVLCPRLASLKMCPWKGIAHVYLSTCNKMKKL